MGIKDSGAGMLAHSPAGVFLLEDIISTVSSTNTVVMISF